MGTVLLVRHGLTAQTGPVLTGWTPGVSLDERGRAQATALGQRLAPLPLTAVVASPLERCQETAAALLAGRDTLAVQTEERLGECGYGSWTGRELKVLAKDPLWKVVQAHPSAVTFPDGESMVAIQARAVQAVRDWDARLGPDALWAAVSHGDVIKAILADALGMHLDSFQRLVVNPSSLSVVRYTPLRAFVLRVNDVGAPVDDLRPPKGRRRRRASSDAAVGGGGGTGAPT